MCELENIEIFHWFCLLPSFNCELQKTPQMQARQTHAINLLICANKEFSNMAGGEILLFEQRILANIFQKNFKNIQIDDDDDDDDD